MSIVFLKFFYFIYMGIAGNAVGLACLWFTLRQSARWLCAAFGEEDLLCFCAIISNRVIYWTDWLLYWWHHQGNEVIANGYSDHSVSVLFSGLSDGLHGRRSRIRKYTCICRCIFRVNSWKAGRIIAPDPRGSCFFWPIDRWNLERRSRLPNRTSSIFRKRPVPLPGRPGRG